MSINVGDNLLLNVRHDDKDLVQLSGYHAYQNYKKGNRVRVNGKIFYVEDVKTDPSTGLDALVVRNITPLTEDGVMNFDGELIIVYVGSVPSQLKEDWIETNVNLIGGADPV